MTSCFQRVERRFFVLEYRKRHSLCLYCQKKKVGKMASFRPKPWVNPFWKTVNISTFWTLCFYSLERRFTFWNIIKNIFWPILPTKKKVGKMAIFGPKPWVNIFGKMSVCRLSGLLLFIAQKGVFSFQNNIKDIFLACIV